MPFTNPTGYIIASLFCLAILAFACSTGRTCWHRLCEWRHNRKQRGTVSVVSSTSQNQRAMIADAYEFELQPVRGARPALYRAVDVEMPVHTV